MARIRILAVEETSASTALLERALARIGPDRVELVVIGATAPRDVFEQLQRADLLVALREAAAPRAVPPALPVAMASGLCVIASAVGGVPGVITHGFDGCLVPVGDEDALVDALEAVLDDQNERRRLGEAAAASIRGALRSA